MILLHIRMEADPMVSGVVEVADLAMEEDLASEITK